MCVNFVRMFVTHMWQKNILKIIHSNTVKNLKTHSQLFEQVWVKSCEFVANSCEGGFCPVQGALLKDTLHVVRKIINWKY